LFFSDRPTVALLASWIFAFQSIPILLINASIPTDHIDHTLMTIVLGGIYFGLWFIRKKRSVFLLLSGLLLGFGLLTKLWPALLIWVVFSWMLLVFWKKHFIIPSMLHLLLGLAIVSPWLYYTWLHFPNEFKWENAGYFQHFKQPIEKEQITFFAYMRYCISAFSPVLFISLFIRAYLKSVN